jgi:hypothetical protein
MTPARALAGIAGLAGLAACSGAGSGAAADGVDASGDDDASIVEASQGKDAAARDGARDASLEGACEPVEGTCDLVLQNCPPGSQCTVQPKSGGGGGYVAACGPTYPVQHIDRGYACCPPTTFADDPCLPGLKCIGDPCVGEAGTGVAGGGGRCTPYCCAGDDTPCATSPEGFPGHCDIGVVDTAGTVLYDVCDYAPPCQPLGLVPCPPGYGCLVQDKAGDAKCAQLYNAGSPPGTEGQPCEFNNACQDGLMCLTSTSTDGGTVSSCLMLCYTGQGSPPFDAGALGGTPGRGGCNPGKQCISATQIFPAWLGVCI